MYIPESILTNDVTTLRLYKELMTGVFTALGVIPDAQMRQDIERVYRHNEFPDYSSLIWPPGEGLPRRSGGQQRTRERRKLQDPEGALFHAWSSTNNGG